MTANHLEIWRKCLEVIRDNTSEQSYATWFKPIVPIALSGSVLTIQVPSQFFYEWLEEHYIDLLRKTIKRFLGPDGKLEYSILMDSTDRSYTMVMPGSTRNNTKNPIGRPAPETLSQKNFNTH